MTSGIHSEGPHRLTLARPEIAPFPEASERVLERPRIRQVEPRVSGGVLAVLEKISPEGPIAGRDP